MKEIFCIEIDVEYDEEKDVRWRYFIVKEK